MIRPTPRTDKITGGWWEANALLRGGEIEIQTQQFEKDFRLIATKLIGGVMDRVRGKIKELWLSESLLPTEDKVHPLYEDDSIKIIGNTKGERNYLYLLAYEKL